MHSIRSLGLKIFLLFILWFCGGQANIQAQISIGARNVALGHAISALPGNEWAVFENPALIPEDTHSLGFYGLRNYGFAELTDMATAAAIPLRFGVLSAGFHHYGDQLFSESRMRLGYSLKWNQLSGGVVANYNHISFGGSYGSGGALGIDAGIGAEISHGLFVGAKATNLNYPVYPGIDEDLQRNLSLGMSYRAEPEVLFLLELFKDVRFPLSFRAGLEIEVIEDLFSRVGISTEPVVYAGGFGYQMRNWQVNLVAEKHQLLGFSPGFDLLFYFR